MRDTSSRNPFAHDELGADPDAIRIPPELTAMWQEMRAAIATGLAAEPIEPGLPAPVRSETVGRPQVADY